MKGQNELIIGVIAVLIIATAIAVQLWNPNFAAPTGKADEDITPPVLSNGRPTGGPFPAGTTQVGLSLFTTNENASCKYSTKAGIVYASMPNIFTSADGTFHLTSVTGLQNGQTYNYYVRCKDIAGNANTSDYVISFSVASSGADTTPPVLFGGTPTDTVFIRTGGLVDLVLGTSENAVCKYSTTPKTPYASMPNTFTAQTGTFHVTSVSFSGTQIGKTYNYYVRCQDTAGNANTSDYVISFFVAPGYCANETTQNCTTTENCAGTQTCVNTSWSSCVDDPNDNCPSLSPICGNGIIDQGEECETDAECINAYPENSCDYDLKKYGSRSVECNSCICSVESWNYSTTKYCNSCKHCGDKEINCSETKETCPEDTSAPTRPTGLELIRTTENSVIIQWNPNTEENLKKYVIYYGTNSRNYTEKETVDKEKISFTLTKLKKATRYYIALTAENTKGIESNYSNEIIATTQQGAPLPIPQKLKATQKNNYVYLEWNHTNPKPENYIIERKDANSWEEIKTTSTNNYNDKSVETEKTYTYRIKAYDKERTSDYSNETKITIKKPEEKKDDTLPWIIGTAIIIIAGTIAYAHYHFKG